MLWLLMLAWIQPCYSHALYAYNTERTIQVGAQDPTTGKILYSNCNSKKTPIFPLDKPNILDAKETPKNGTALAGAGWYDFNQEKVIASLFWQSKDNAIVNGYYQCDMKTGKLVRSGEYRISETAEIDSIHNNSGLAVDLLGADNGYRVFYHDEERNVMVLRYTQTTDWADGGYVSQGIAAGMAIGSAHIDKENMTVAFPRGENDIWTSRLEKSGRWRLAGFPTGIGNNFTNNSKTIEPTDFNPPTFTLPAWNSSLEAMGSSIDRSRKRSIFYIGTDSKLHEVAATRETWNTTSNQTEEVWPTADDPNSGIAVAYFQPDGKSWIYYWSNKTIVQAYRNYDGKWEDAVALPQEEPSKTDNNPPAQTETPDESSGLSSGAKAGIGVGVGVGALLAGVLGWLWMKRRNKKKGSGVSEVGSPTDSHFTEVKKNPTEMDGHGRPAELENRPSVVYELQGQH
ncbi:uncharacterized protein B0J16DRAFT_353504 [Fusarium flagelliforme]|uniref:uncharacterized protein n=1 Tax=Fusarium flagelliforme TaxID=2675880 RepID=UPI001E8E9C62|nr:uncharacterized protein B0J16DRAFT_353504 [Fusarium flagelliforme]KAH7191893.1 hypothetical protein B0J16DRAFT_353504 [Fusarium flagelliforme]